jgi:TonB family protein
MRERFRSWAAVSLLVFFVSCGMRAQAASGSKKNCVPPRVIYSPEPGPSHYPKKDSADVSIDVLIDAKGKVLEPKVVTSSGTDEFDHDAIVAVRAWRFKPSTCDGKPIPVHIIVQVHSSVKH